MPRPTAAKQIEVRADCQRCNWTSEKRNAQALAARHFDSKGHLVVVRVTNEITYGSITGKTKAKDGQESML